MFITNKSRTFASIEHLQCIVGVGRINEVSLLTGDLKYGKGVQRSLKVRKAHSVIERPWILLPVLLVTTLYVDLRRNISNSR